MPQQSTNFNFNILLYPHTCQGPVRARPVKRIQIDLNFPPATTTSLQLLWLELVGVQQIVRHRLVVVVRFVRAPPPPTIHCICARARHSPPASSVNNNHQPSCHCQQPATALQRQRHITNIDVRSFIQLERRLAALINQQFNLINILSLKLILLININLLFTFVYVRRRRARHTLAPGPPAPARAAPPAHPIAAPPPPIIPSSYHRRHHHQTAATRAYATTHRARPTRAPDADAIVHHSGPASSAPVVHRTPVVVQSL